MKRRDFMALGACATAAQCMAVPVPKVDLSKLTMDDYEKAVALLDSTRPEDIAKRKPALDIMQKYIWGLEKGKNYSDFCKAGLEMDEAAVKKTHETFPALKWYDHGFDKVLKEMKETKVEGAKPAIWYVYNMGIVVKTKTCSFAIDLCHRKAAAMVPHIDFAICSHRHGDHYTEEFFRAMWKAQKPVMTNFILSKWYCKRDGEFNHKGLKIRATEADHNPNLRWAILCSEITCGEGEDTYTLFHSGDCNRADHLRPATKNPDIFFGHCAIGLNFKTAWNTTMPAKMMVPLHHQELGHLAGRYRCVAFGDEPKWVLHEMKKLGVPSVMPVWGDRIV